MVVDSGRVRQRSGRVDPVLDHSDVGPSSRHMDQRERASLQNSVEGNARPHEARPNPALATSSNTGWRRPSAQPPALRPVSGARRARSYARLDGVASHAAQIASMSSAKAFRRPCLIGHGSIELVGRSTLRRTSKPPLHHRRQPILCSRCKHIGCHPNKQATPSELGLTHIRALCSIHAPERHAAVQARLPSHLGYATALVTFAPLLDAERKGAWLQ
jgi:hypothetical protein